MNGFIVHEAKGVQRVWAFAMVNSVRLYAKSKYTGVLRVYNSIEDSIEMNR